MLQEVSLGFRSYPLQRIKKLHLTQWVNPSTWPRKWNGLWSSSFPGGKSSSSHGNQLAKHNCPLDWGEFSSSRTGSAMPSTFLKNSLGSLWWRQCCWWVPIGTLVLLPSSLAMRCSHTPSELQRRKKQLQNLPQLKLTHTAADDPAAGTELCCCTGTAAFAHMQQPVQSHISRPGQLSPGHHFRGWWPMYKTGAVGASEGYKVQQQQPKQMICWIIWPVSRAAWLSLGLH